MPARSALLRLGYKLLSSGPPSLKMLIVKLEDSEDFLDFLRLVRMVLPDRELDILGGPTPFDQMIRFASYFEERYFPIPEGFEEYSQLTPQIPILPMGMEWDEIHEIPTNYRPGLQLMTFIIDPQNEFDDIRASLADACTEYVPVELLTRLGQGIPRDELRRLLNGTPHSGLVNWANYLANDTGNGLLDLTVDMMGYEWTDWDMDAVQHITQLYLQAQQYAHEYQDLCDWLEEDMPARFEELLDFIDKRRAENDTETRGSNPAVDAA